MQLQCSNLYSVSLTFRPKPFIPRIARKNTPRDYLDFNLRIKIICYIESIRNLTLMINIAVEFWILWIFIGDVIFIDGVIAYVIY